MPNERFNTPFVRTASDRDVSLDGGFLLDGFFLVGALAFDRTERRAGLAGLPRAVFRFFLDGGMKSVSFRRPQPREPRSSDRY